MGAGNGGFAGVGNNAARPGYSVINKFGVNFDIDTTETPIEIWSHGSDGTRFPFLDVGIAMDLVSTSVNDTAAGSGTQTVTITHYSTDNTETVEIFEMDGTTRVQVSDDIKFCSRIKQVTSGVSNTNEGEINLVDRATGLVVYQSVEIGEGQTLAALQIVPKGKVGVVVCHSVTYAKDQQPLTSADMRFQVRGVDGSVITKHPTTISVAKPEDEKIYRVGGIEMVEGEIAYWECIAVGANDTPIEGRFDMEIFDA